MAITDPAVKDWIDVNAAWLQYAAPIAGALTVIVIGKVLAWPTHIAPEEHAPDLAADDPQPSAPHPVKAAGQARV